jgi:hypothetical protein
MIKREREKQSTMPTPLGEFRNRRCFRPIRFVGLEVQGRLLAVKSTKYERLGLSGCDALKLLSFNIRPICCGTVDSEDPPAFCKYAHVEPETRLCYYQSLATGKMTQMIFSTALFYETVKHLQPTGSCEQKIQ